MIAASPALKAAMAFTAGTSLLVGQVIDLKLSGAQVVGWAVGIVGFLLAGLISLVTWFASREFKTIKDTQIDQGKTLAAQDRALFQIATNLDAITLWKEERQRVHDERGREQEKELRQHLKGGR